MQPRFGAYWRETVAQKRKSKNRVRPLHPPAEAISRIALAAASAMSVPGAFTRKGMAFDPSGKPVSVFGSEATERDALGWVLKHTYDNAAEILNFERKKTELAYKVSEILNAQCIALVGRTLVSVSDEEGASSAASLLKKIAENLSEHVG